MTKQQRVLIVDVLKTKVGPKAATTYENAIYELVKRKATQSKKSIESIYADIGYQKCGEIMNTTEKEQRDAIYRDLKNNVEGWDSSVYAKQRLEQSLFNQKLQDKGKLTKGAYYCRDKIKCGSDECYSYQQQTRGNDEGATTFIICAKCGLRYKFS